MCKKILLLISIFLIPVYSLAVQSINATFDDIQSFTTYKPVVFIAGNPVPTADNASDRPRYISSAEKITVENKNTVEGTTLLTNNFMQILSNKDENVVFDLTDTVFTSGIVKISWDMLIKSNGDYYFKFTGPRGNLTGGTGLYSEILASIEADINGKINFLNNNYSSNYIVNKPIHFECYLNLDTHVWAVIKNGDVIFNDGQLGDSSFAAVIIGFTNNNPISMSNIQIDNVQVIHSKAIDWWPGTSTSCPDFLPNPNLILIGTRNSMIGNNQVMSYLFNVANYFYYPDTLFQSSPTLPPCGLNTSASRTWVDFYNQNNLRMYGFCGFNKSENLNDLWISSNVVQDLDSSSIKIKMEDRLCNKTYISNDVNIYDGMFATLTLNVTGSGKVTTNDPFVCISDNLSNNVTCTLKYLKGQKIKLTPEAISGDTFTSQFYGWNGVNCMEDECEFNIYNNMTVDANFVAMGNPVYYMIPVPASQNSYNYNPITTPYLSNDVSKVKPLAVGNINSGSVNLQIMLPDFQDFVDVYFAIGLPNGTVLIVDENNNVHDLNTVSVLPKWKSSLKNHIEWQTSEIPLSNIPKGHYTLYLAVTKVNDITKYYFWETYFDNN